ncbi:unnamed protein product [Effrenium voratum]|nr:unnamed protein product [Effrenium voratum]
MRARARQEMDGLGDSYDRLANGRQEDEVLTASERGAAVVAVLRRTEGRLERLQQRLQNLLRPESNRTSPVHRNLDHDLMILSSSKAHRPEKRPLSFSCLVHI